MSNLALIPVVDACFTHTSIKTTDYDDEAADLRRSRLELPERTC